MNPVPVARLDKWLWAVRLFRSRSAATDACHAGHVKIAGERVKPARGVRPGDTVHVRAGGVERIVRVRIAIEQRVGVAMVPDCLEDLTPPERIAEAQAIRREQATHAPHGGGRPTKKQRRQLDALEW